MLLIFNFLQDFLTLLLSLFSFKLENSIWRREPQNIKWRRVCAGIENQDNFKASKIQSRSRLLWRRSSRSWTGKIVHKCQTSLFAGFLRLYTGQVQSGIFHFKPINVMKVNKTCWSVWVHFYINCLDGFTFNTTILY